MGGAEVSRQRVAWLRHLCLFGRSAKVPLQGYSCRPAALALNSKACDFSCLQQMRPTESEMHPFRVCIVSHDHDVWGRRGLRAFSGDKSTLHFVGAASCFGNGTKACITSNMVLLQLHCARCTQEKRQATCCGMMSLQPAFVPSAGLLLQHMQKASLSPCIGAGWLPCWAYCQQTCFTEVDGLGQLSWRQLKVLGCRS